MKFAHGIRLILFIGKYTAVFGKTRGEIAGEFPRGEFFEKGRIQGVKFFRENFYTGEFARIPI